MRTIIAFTFCLVGCTSNTTITPEPDAGPKKDAATIDATPDGSSSDGGQGGGYTSGSRLKARTYDGKDGSKQFVGWYDTMRMESCEYAFAGDGALRCLPIADQCSRLSTEYFKDAQCLQPYAEVNRGCTPRYAISTPNFCAHPPTKIYAPGTLANNASFRKSQGCSGPIAFDQNGPDLWNPGAEIPAATFQEATESHE